MRTSALLLALAGVLTGCDLGALFVDAAPAASAGVVDAPALVIPPNLQTRRPLTVEEALDTYPAPGEGLSREPFLTASEQQALLTGRTVTAQTKVVRRPITTTKTADKPGTKGLGWLEHADMGFIVFGRQNGLTTAIIEGQMLQEGTVVGEYVVVAIDENEGVRLKELNGQGTRIKRFPRTGEWPGK